MFLYHLTLQKPGGINQAVVGSFSAPKLHELVVARGDVLELLRPDESGKVQTVLRCGAAVAAPSRRVRIRPSRG
jgi:splicing factor 3B subunit 3